MLFNQVFDFYGGYAQMSADAKDQAFESKILMQLLHKIGALKGEIA